MRSLAVLGLLGLSVVVGCSAPAAVDEEQELASSHLASSHLEQTEASDEPEALEVGAELTVRLSVDIRADLLPNAKLSEMGPFQAITYGKSPDILSFGTGDWRCEARGTRPTPGMNEKYFPPIMPSSLHMTVLPRPEGTAGVTIFLRTTEPDAHDTTWSIDCVKNGTEDRGASLAELREALGAGSAAQRE